MVRTAPFLAVFLGALSAPPASLRTASAAAAEEAQHVVSHGQSQVDWLRSHGGYFSPKIRFQPLGAPDENAKSPNGMFTSESITKGETLLVVPQKCLITSGGSGKMCDTARNLIKEMRKVQNGDESYFAPYVNYLLDAKRGQLPSAWSEPGKEVLITMLGDELYPDDVAGHSFKESCARKSGEEVGEFEENAYLHMLARSWEDLIVCTYDMINHRNGRYFNVDSNSPHDGDDIKVYARRDIQAGEQLYLSYNECTGPTCEGMAYRYVTPHIMKDYGFVEQFPQRWMFDADPTVVFQLDEIDEEGEGGESDKSKGGDGAAAAAGEHKKKKGKPQLKVTWFKKSGKPAKVPNLNQFQYLRRQLRRLRGMGTYIYQETAKLESSHERNTTREFYEAYITALEVGIAAAVEEGGYLDMEEDSEDDSEDSEDSGDSEESEDEEDSGDEEDSEDEEDTNDEL